MLISLNRRRLLALIGLAPLAPAAAATVRPSRTPVRVLFTRVNGEHYYEAAASLPTLTEGTIVTLLREPTNEHDRRAIEVLDPAGRKLGNVARVDNSAVARMMDTGEQFAARVARIDRAAMDIRLEVDWVPL